MGIGVSVFLMAVGAIMTFAIETNSTEGININTVGIILMIVGAVGLLASLIIFGPRGRARDQVVETRREVV
jgi:hypothetical protein